MLNTYTYFARKRPIKRPEEGVADGRIILKYITKSDVKARVSLMTGPHVAIWLTR
jgi:hypothetical protein